MAAAQAGSLMSKTDVAGFAREAARAEASSAATAARPGPMAAWVAGAGVLMGALAGVASRLRHSLPYVTVRRVKAVLAGVTCFLVLASIATSYLITQRQDALQQMSRDNLTFVASLASVEVMRLEAAIAEAAAPGSGVGRDQVQLRLDIVRNRISLLENSEVGDFIQHHADLQATVAQLRSTVEAAQPLIDDLGHDAVSRLLKLTSPLVPQLLRLAAAVNSYHASLAARDQAELSRLHMIFSAIICGLAVCGFGLIGVVTAHNRLLGRAHAAVNALVRDLRERDRTLATQNARFDAALNNMSQALCMVDQEQRVIVCNSQFLALFDLPADAVQPGAPMEDVFRAAAAASRYEREVIEAVCGKQRDLITAARAGSFFQEADGRAIAVSHQPMPANGWVATYEDISERRRAEARIQFMAHHDALTSLPNRLHFEDKLVHALKGTRQEDGSLAVLCLDLDHFKEVNDSLGHPAGDQLLKQVAQRALGCVRGGDIVARLGGDEFAILQSSACQPEHAEALARRLVKALGAPYDIDGTRVVVGASVGIAIARGDGRDADHLLKNADIALYKAKGEGRGTFRLFEDEMDAQLQARRAMESDLHEAIDRHELGLFYQPLFDLAADKVAGFEALLRWRHPSLGIVFPAQFIPVAEDVGLIDRIGEWALAQACRDAAAWPEDIAVSVNVSSSQFRNGNLVRAVRSALDAAGLPPRRLALEVTESALIKGSRRVLATLHELRDLGVEIALDDFGTEYSSLSCLRSFAFDRIKIDRSFVHDMGRRPDCLAIVRSVAQLAQTLGMAATAEGIETPEQLDRVRKAGCTQAQGDHFDQPRPVSEIARWFGLPAAPLELTDCLDRGRTVAAAANPA